MNRFLRLLCVACFVLASPVAAAEPPRLNVVLIVADDHGRDAGCYGNRDVRTPHLDRLAADGTRFDFGFCTTASCSASRSVLLSGLHNHHNGQFGHQHSFHHFSSFAGVKSLPVILADAGYRTAQIGKYHVAPEKVYHFDTYLSGNQGGARNPVSMAETCRSIIEAKDERPFFLYYATADPHRGGGVVASDPHRPDAFGNGPTYEGVNEERYDPKTLTVPPFLPDTPACRSELAQYYQSVSRVDQGVGRLVEILKSAGVYERTLIIYLSDNGMAFPGSKTTLYEPGMRLPLIVRAPDQAKKGGVSDAMVTWADITPTILDYAGVKQVAGPPLRSSDDDGRAAKAVGGKQAKADYRFDGRSFRPAIAKGTSDGFDEIQASHTFHEITMYYPMRVIRTRTHKLFLNIAHPLPFPFASDLQASATWKSVSSAPDAMYGKRKVRAFIHRPQYELYDLTSDPDEVVNLANDAESANVLRELQEKLKAFQQRTSDPWIVKYEYE